MKRYTEYTKTELAVLSDDNIQLLVELEAACAGIMPCEQPQKILTLEELVTKTVVAFQIKDLVFMDESQAREVAGKRIYREDYDSSIGYNFKWITLNPDVEVERVMYYEREDLIRQKQKLVADRVKRDEHKKQEDAYSEYQSKLVVISKAIWNVVNEARSFAGEVKHALATCDRYLVLADGNASVALQFFLDAFKSRPDLIEAVRDIFFKDVRVQGDDPLVEAK